MDQWPLPKRSRVLASALSGARLLMPQVTDSETSPGLTIVEICLPYSLPMALSFVILDFEKTLAERGGVSIKCDIPPQRVAQEL